MPQIARSGRARISMRRPRAMGECDRCGFWHNHGDMVRQFQWSGNALVDTGLLVGRDCLDTPQQQLRSIILPPDPRPIINARPSPNVTPIAWRPGPVAGGYLTDEYGNVITDEYGNPIAIDADGTTTTPQAVLPTSPENQGFTVYNLDSIAFATYPSMKTAVLAEIASISGIPTPAQIFDRSTTIAAQDVGQSLMTSQPARGWLLLYNPVVAPVQISLSTSVAWGYITNLTLGPGEAFFWADAQLLQQTWHGAISLVGLMPGMDFYAWESGGNVAWLTDEFGNLLTDENGQAIPLS